MGLTFDEIILVWDDLEALKQEWWNLTSLWELQLRGEMDCVVSATEPGIFQELPRTESLCWRATDSLDWINTCEGAPNPLSFLDVRNILLSCDNQKCLWIGTSHPGEGAVVKLEWTRTEVDYWRLLSIKKWEKIQKRGGQQIEEYVRFWYNTMLCEGPFWTELCPLNSHVELWFPASQNTTEKLNPPSPWLGPFERISCLTGYWYTITSDSIYVEKWETQESRSMSNSVPMLELW